MERIIKDGKEYICLDDYIATKLWSDEDVRGCVSEKYPEYSDEEVDEIVSDVINSGYLNPLEDCTDEDWDIINYAIDEIEREKYTTIVTNIVWDIDDGDDIMLPHHIYIPGYPDDDEISDYITNRTGFCHKGFSVIRRQNEILEE